MVRYIRLPTHTYLDATHWFISVGVTVHALPRLVLYYPIAYTAFRLFYTRYRLVTTRGHGCHFIRLAAAAPRTPTTTTAPTRPLLALPFAHIAHTTRTTDRPTRPPHCCALYYRTPSHLPTPPRLLALHTYLPSTCYGSTFYDTGFVRRCCFVWFTITITLLPHRRLRGGRRRHAGVTYVPMHLTPTYKFHRCYRTLLHHYGYAFALPPYPVPKFGLPLGPGHYIPNYSFDPGHVLFTVVAHVWLLVACGRRYLPGYPFGAVWARLCRFAFWVGSHWTTRTRSYARLRVCAPRAFVPDTTPAFPH